MLVDTRAKLWCASRWLVYPRRLSVSTHRALNPDVDAGSLSVSQISPASPPSKFSAHLLWASKYTPVLSSLLPGFQYVESVIGLDTTNYYMANRDKGYCTRM